MKGSATLNVVELPITAIQPSKFPLRRFYDEEALRELGESVSEIGGIYPVVVRPVTKTGTRFELVIGSRRLKSAKQRHAKTITAVVLSEVDDKRSLVLALSENLQRKDLDPFEEATGFLTLIRDFKMSEKEVAKHLSCKETLIRSRLKILSLPPAVQKLVANKKLGIDKVDTIAGLSEKDQLKYAEAAVEHALTEKELSVLTEHDSVKRHSGLKRRHPERFTGKRVSLKIYAFAEWLGGATKHILDMSRKDRQLIKEALDVLVTNANEISKHSTTGPQASKLAKAIGKLHRV